MSPTGEDYRDTLHFRVSTLGTTVEGKDVAEPKFRVGDTVRAHLGTWEAEDVIVQGPICQCKPREVAETHPDDHFAYLVKDEPFVIRESLLMAV
jgi:hypothetical protein